MSGGPMVGGRPPLSETITSLHLNGAPPREKGERGSLKGLWGLVGECGVEVIVCRRRFSAL